MAVRYVLVPLLVALVSVVARAQASATAGVVTGYDWQGEVRNSGVVALGGYEVVWPRPSVVRHNAEWGALAYIWAARAVKSSDWEVSPTVGGYIRLRRDLYVEALGNMHYLSDSWGEEFARAGAGVRYGDPWDDALQVSVHVWSRGEQNDPFAEITGTWGSFLTLRAAGPFDDNRIAGVAGLDLAYVRLEVMRSNLVGDGDTEWRIGLDIGDVRWFRGRRP